MSSPLISSPNASRSFLLIYCSVTLEIFGRTGPSVSHLRPSSACLSLSVSTVPHDVLTECNDPRSVKKVVVEAEKSPEQDEQSSSEEPDAEIVSKGQRESERCRADGIIGLEP